MRVAGLTRDLSGAPCFVGCEVGYLAKAEPGCCRAGTPENRPTKCERGRHKAVGRARGYRRGYIEQTDRTSWREGRGSMGSMPQDCPLLLCCTAHPGTRFGGLEGLTNGTEDARWLLPRNSIGSPNRLTPQANLDTG